MVRTNGIRCRERKQDGNDGKRRWKQEPRLEIRLLEVNNLGSRAIGKHRGEFGVQTEARKRNDDS